MRRLARREPHARPEIAIRQGRQERRRQRTVLLTLYLGIALILAALIQLATTAPGTPSIAMSFAHAGREWINSHPGRDPKGWRYYVATGDTLWQLGVLYRVSPQTIAQASGISVDTPLSVGQELVIPSVPPLLKASDTINPDLAQLLMTTAHEFGLPPALLEGMAWQETHWGQMQGPGPGVGVLQVTPQTAAWAQSFVPGIGDIYSLDGNIRSAAALMRYFWDVTGGVRAALIRYGGYSGYADAVFQAMQDEPWRQTQ